MLSKDISLLKQLLHEFSTKMRTFSEEKMTDKLDSNKWSIKEIIGHLIDSAANNHHRFVRAQYEEKPTIFYDQNNWVAIQNYQNRPGNELVQLWQLYNKHLIHVVENIPRQKYNNLCNISDTGKEVTLRWLVEDYVRHLQHHLNQIF